MAQTRCEAISGPRAARANILARQELSPLELRAALVSWYDGWLAGLLPSISGVALVATGSLGRCEPTPYGDVDLVVVHNGQNAAIADVAQAIWYPVWDVGCGLDHAVRTVPEAVAAATADVKSALSLLSARHLAGDQSISVALRDAVLSAWRRYATRLVPRLRTETLSRWDSYGEAAFLLEPDLKNARGGLRDVQTITALAAAQLVDGPSNRIRAAYRTLLDIRVELHRQANRGIDRLVAQEREGVAAALGYAKSDSMLRAIAQSARDIAFAADLAWRQAQAEITTMGSSWRSRRRKATRRPLAEGIVEHSGEVVLARDATPAKDPVLLLRAAATAAYATVPLAPHTLRRLATESEPLPTPWPAEALSAFLALLSTGKASITVLESLDQCGLLGQLLPQWERVRFLPQHDPAHRFTVDRHLMETAAHAASLTSRVSRPDLLLLAAFLHDIGKGSAGDHSYHGALIAQAIGIQIGLSQEDVRMLALLVRQHLLLPHLATRRDLSDPITVRTVVEAVDGSRDLLELLHALTESDARATGPGSWSDWKAGLVSELVEQAKQVMDGAPYPREPELTAAEHALLRSGELRIDISEHPIAGQLITLTAPSSHGLLSRAVGVLALHHLDIHAATVMTADRGVVCRFTVLPRFGRGPDASVIRDDVRLALRGGLALGVRLAAQEREYQQRSVNPAPAHLQWCDGEATQATVLELRAPDGVGLLYRVTSALERCGVEIHSARANTLAGTAMDAFYLALPAGGPVVDSAHRTRIEAAVVAAASGAPT